MPTRLPRLAAALLGLALSLPAAAWELAGTKTIRLHPRAGAPIVVGTVDFKPAGGRIAFSLNLHDERFQDFFLSMREFKCLEGEGEVQCHVRYPYTRPDTITADDFAWLEHALLFLYKQPRDFGANLRNGLYYRLTRTANGLVGTPQAIDLKLIGAPPDQLSVPPYGEADRADVEPDARWFKQLTIE